MNIGEKEKKQIETVIKQYYNKNEKYSLKYCYEKFLNCYYIDKDSSNFVEAYPTLAQFKYHAKKFIDMRKRIGEKKI